ncbi:MAG: hypothetical protein ACLGIA_10550 [Actinomycetes bacterium]
MTSSSSSLRMLRALVVALTLLASLLLVPRPASAGPLTAEPQTAAPSRTDVPGPVVLVGVPGLRWDDASAEGTPALWSLLENASVGTLATRSVRRSACPIDGWLAVSSGSRLGDELSSVGCNRPLDPYDGVVGSWPRYQQMAASQTFQAQPGLLGDTLSKAGVRTVALGPGAAVALADPTGRVVGPYLERPDSVQTFETTVRSALATRPDLLVVDAGAVRDPADLPSSDHDQLLGDRASQVADLDRRVGAVLAAAGSGATVLIASFADAGSSPHLGLLAARGPAGTDSTYGSGLLGSRSTRQAGLVQTTDIAPTVLDLLGVRAPSGLVGAPIRPLRGTAASPGQLLQKLVDLNTSASTVNRLVPPFFLGLVFAELLLYGIAALALRVQWGGPAGRRPVLRWMRRVAIVFASVPVSTFLANLVPWWRTGHDLLAVVAAVAFWTALVAAFAMLGPWRDHRLGPFGAVAGVTAFVLAVDVATGSHLQLSSLMGQQPLVAGRFYGLGNQQFALFATGALLLATALADAALNAGRRRLAVWVVVVIGVLAVVIDGTPGIGSDFGGPPAIVPAFAVLALLVAGVRLNLRTLLLVGVGTLAVVVTLSVLDWLRPPENRTHLGRFVETVLNGGALTVIERKLTQNWDILTSSPLSLLVPFGAVFVGLVLMRPVAWGAPALQRTYEHAPTLRNGLFALLVMLAIGFAVNDSGTVVPAIGGVLAIPLLIAASVRTLELADEQSASGETPTPAEPERGARPAPR